MIDLLDEIKNELISSQTFKYSRAQGAGTVKFAASGELLNASDGTVRWTVSYGGADKRSPVMRLMDKSGKTTAILSLQDGGGFWKGRSFVDTGYCEVRPLKNELKWRDLSHPVHFYRKIPVIPEELGARGKVPPLTFKEAVAPQIDWTPYEYDLSKSIKKGAYGSGETAICLIACDRPAYFEQMAKSLALNPKTSEMPVFLFLDKPPREADVSTMDEQAKLCRELFPHCIIVKRERNFGCGRNLIDARIQLFENLKYESVFVFEDDMVVSPQYVQLCQNLAIWADANFSNVGVVQGWSACRLSGVEKDMRLKEVHVTYENWWGYLMKRQAWMAFSKTIKEYQELFLGGTYSARPHRTICEWFRRKRTYAPQVIGNRQPELPENVKTHRDAYFDKPPTGQDATTAILMEQAGYVRLGTTVNRGLYIGKQGIHMNPRMFVRDGLDLIQLEPYEDDRSRVQFATEVATVETVESEDSVKGFDMIEAL